VAVIERKVQRPEATRGRILEAALECFALKGFGATSIGEIAERAKVRKSLVLYHFDSKEVLWQAAIADMAEPMMQMIERYLGDREPALDLGGLVRGRFEFLLTHPEVPRILTWVGLDPESLAPQRMRELGPRLAVKVLNDLEGRCEDPPIMAATIMGAMDAWFRYRPMYAHISLIPESSDANERFIQGLLRLIEGGGKEDRQ